MLTINKIVYNPPATIVFWNDGTKTVSKCEWCDIYTKEMGFMLCVLKKKYGNKTFHDMMEKYVYGVDGEPTEGNPVVWNRHAEKKKDRPIVKLMVNDKDVKLSDEETDEYLDMLMDLWETLWGDVCTLKK